MKRGVWRAILPRSGFRTFILILCGFYLFMVFSFHANLQGSSRERGVVAPPRFRRAEDQQQERQPMSDKANGMLLFSKSAGDFPKQNALLQAYAGRVEERSSLLKDSSQKAKEFQPEKPHRHPEETCTGEEVDEFVFRQVLDEVILFSAYWDLRPNDFDNKENGTIIRIMAVVRRGAKPRLSCAFPTYTEEGTGELSEVSYYEMCENHGRPWGSYILSCRVPAAIKEPLCSVKLTSTTVGWLGTSDSAVSVTIRRLKPMGQPNHFATCVPPLFGKVSAYQLAEFIEMTKALGSQSITFYDYSIVASTRKLLDYYAEQGVVQIVPWGLPPHINSGMWYYGQMLAIQDCLYRNMRSAYYVTFNDIDEFMVPHGPNMLDWRDVVRQLSQPKTAGFSFISAFFDPYRTESKDPKYANYTALQSVERTSAFSHVRTKCMVQAYNIFEKGIHHVSKPIFADLQIHKIEDSFAFLHHYRKCVSNFGMDCSSYQEDRILLRFADTVVGKVEDTVALIENKK